MKKVLARLAKSTFCIIFCLFSALIFCMFVSVQCLPSGSTDPNLSNVGQGINHLLLYGCDGLGDADLGPPMPP